VRASLPKRPALTLRHSRGSQPSLTLYLRFEDSFPEDGWGAWLSHLRLELERA